MTELLSLPDLPANLAAGAQMLVATPGASGGVAYKAAYGGLLTSASISAVYAPLTSPAFSGTPTAPNAAAGTSTQQVATTAFVASGFMGRTARVVTAAGSVNLAASEVIVFIKKSLGSPTAITLEAAPLTSAMHIIKDARGDATANPITISPASGTIDGAASFSISLNYGAATLVFNGTEWSIV